MNLQVFGANSKCSSTGRLKIGTRLFPCALGRGGIAHNKREGDGCTPVGKLQMLHVFYRPDRIMRPQSSLPVSPLNFKNGWCDDSAAANYNRPVNLPFANSCEHLWRSDNLYDIIIVLDYNFRTVKKGKGSAIFVHVATPDFSPTQGCVALQPAHIRYLLVSVKQPAFLEIS